MVLFEMNPYCTYRITKCTTLSTQIQYREKRVVIDNLCFLTLHLFYSVYAHHIYSIVFVHIVFVHKRTVSLSLV